MKAIHFIFCMCMFTVSCTQDKVFQRVEIPYPEVRSFLKDYLKQSVNTTHELRIENSGSNTTFYLRDVINSCELNLGDELCPFVNENCFFFAPLEYLYIDGHIILLFSGVERLKPSKIRYEKFWEVMEGKLDKCIESYNAMDSTYIINAPRTDNSCTWKFELIDKNRKLITYTPLKECSYDIDSLYEVKIILLQK